MNRDDIPVFAKRPPTPREILLEHLRACGRKGGQATSEAKTKAVRMNLVKAWAAVKTKREE